MALLGLSLGGCGTAHVTPVAMAQPGDAQLACPALLDQLRANRAAAGVYLRGDQAERNGNVAKNVAATLLAPIGMPLIMTTDLSNDEQIRARALVDRNEQLIFLAKQKGCTQP